MQQISTNEKFQSLLLKAFKDWPEEVDLGELLYRDDKGRYQVEGLGDWIEQRISKKYYNQPDEVIMLSLHDSIDIALHDAAKTCRKVRLINLRTEFIKEHFEDKLKAVLQRESLGWGEKDKKLIHDYFSVNKT